MQKLIELKKDDSILVSSKIESFFEPDYVYLPINSDQTFKVKKNDFVKIGDILLDGNTTSIASVSGQVKGLKKLKSIKGEGLFLEIANDFKEQRINIKKSSKFTEETFLKVCPSILNKKNLVLNAIDDEIYVLTNNYYLFWQKDAFLDFLNEIEKNFKLDHVYICLKSNSSENIHQLMNDLGMYPNIELKVVPDLYLLGKKSFLLDYLSLKEENTIFFNTEEFYHLYNYYKRGRTLSDKLITISGNAVKNPLVIAVKIGSLLKDVIKEYITIKSDDVTFIANGLMTGQEIDLNDFVITSDLDSLLIMVKKEKPEPSKCLNCNLCHDICPVGINPLWLNKKEYYAKVKDTCLKCGLCSYICPVYIKFSFRR